MDIFYTVDEKYLQAVEELQYGELPKALRLFNELISADVAYARAYYQLGSIYNYQFKNYQSAGYYYKKCIELEPEFPDAYLPYLKLAIVLNLKKLLHQIVQKALEVPGVCKADIFESLGLYAEKQQNFSEAAKQFRKAALATTCQNEHSSIQEHLKRIGDKQNLYQKAIYAYQG